MAWASANGFVEMVDWFVTKGGADVNQRASENQWTPLMQAAYYGHADTAKRLISLGASIDSTSVDSQTALMIAAAFGQDEVVKVLLFQGANVEAVDKWRDNALLVATNNKHLSVLKLLVTAGANIHTKDAEGETALTCACAVGSPEIVQWLVRDAGMDVNEPAGKSQNTTPLMVASKNGQLETVQLLLTLGANINAKNELSTTAAELAAAEGHLEVFNWLVQNGATIDEDFSIPLKLFIALVNKQTAQIAYLQQQLDTLTATPSST